MQRTIMVRLRSIWQRVTAIRKLHRCSCCTRPDSANSKKHFGKTAVMIAVRYEKKEVLSELVIGLFFQL